MNRVFQRVVRHGQLVALSLAALSAIPAAAAAAPRASAEVIVERFGPERGLPVENVTAILEDTAGFLWIATREGVVMYDGDGATSFEHEIGDPGSISDNYVRTIYEDRSGRLYIGTNSSGLDILDRASWTFTHHRSDQGDPATLSHDSVNVIFEDSHGVIWVGTQIGLNRFDPATGRFERILADPGDPASLSHDYVYAILEDRRGNLWVGTVGGGLNRYDRERDAWTHLRHDASDPASLNSDDVFAMVEDPRGDLWIGTESGLDRFDVESGRFQHFKSRPDGGLSYPLVTSLTIDPEGVLWIGTWGGGVDRLDTASGRFLARPAETAPELGKERVAALATARSGAVWIGTWTKGMYRSRRSPVRATILGPEQGLSFRDVTAVLEDSAGRLWAGTWGGGLNLRPQGSDRFDRSFHERLEQLAQGTVLSIAEAGPGEVWVGTMGPLFRVGPAGELAVYEHDPERPDAIGAGYVTAVLRDSGGVVWAGVGGSGLYRLRRDGSGFDAFRHDPDDPASLSDDYVTALLEDRRGTLWVGTRSGGLNALDRTSGRCRRFQPDPDDPHSLSFHYVTSLALDGSGTVWVGTAGGGLNRVRRSAAGVQFDRFTEKDGLLDDTIRSIAADGAVLWLATARGFSRFDTVTGTSISFDRSDGLPTGGFNGGAARTGADHLYFGTSDGLVAIPRGLPLAPPPPAPTVLREIGTLSGPLAAGRAPWRLERLEIPYGEIVSFAFAVLDYGDVRRHRYAYRLAGMHDEWIDIGDRREVTFTDLEPGDYTLEIRGRSSHGVWSRTAAPLRLVVVPPFWMTLWFRAVVLAGLFVAIVTAHRRRTAVLERRNRVLMALKDEREAALAEARASQRELQEAYERLRRLTRRLEAAKEDERKRIARELHDEMGQGLTAAKINIQLLAASPGSSEAEDRAQDTIELIDRMIGHVRALSLDLRPPLLDELGLVPALRSYLEAQAQRKELTIEMEANGVPGDLPAEVGITAFRFVQEAVTNVIRHAEASRVDVAVRSSGQGLEISVRDDGRGFDVGAALQRAAGGLHLGLLGMRERVESLGGRLEIAASPGAGTRLAVRIPWSGR